MKIKYAFASELRKSLHYPSKPLLKEQKNLHIVTVLKKRVLKNLRLKSKRSKKSKMLIREIINDVTQIFFIFDSLRNTNNPMSLCTEHMVYYNCIPYMCDVINKSH